MKISSKLFAQLERYIRLETIDKLSVVTTYMIVALVVFALGTSAVFFLSNALVEALTLVVGNRAVSYLIVGVVLLLVIWVFLANKKAWVENCIVRSLSETVLSEPSIVGDDIDVEDILDEEGGEK